MINSSIGYHTFCIFKKVDDFKTLKRIYSKFEKYKKKNPDMISSPLIDKNKNKIGWKFYYQKNKTIFYKGIMPSEKILDLPVDCNFLTGSVNL